MFQLLINGIFLLLFLYLATSVLYLLMLAVAGRLCKKKLYDPVNEKKSIAVFIPSYREDEIIVDTAMQAAKHNYPSDKFAVIVIADQLMKETINTLEKLPVNVVEVEFDVSMKSKSLQAALNTFSCKKFDIAMVLDADNVMEKDCLEKVNAAFHDGYRVAQCHRTAKNQHTPVALLDAVSEEINNHIFRKGQRALQLPSSLIGSGIAFDYELLNDIFNDPVILNNPGEDREIDIQLVMRDIDVEYIEDAFVYDEKVAGKAVFEKQRVRWLEAQLTHAKSFLQERLKPQRLSRVFLHKFFQCFLLPRLLYITVFAIVLILLVFQYFTVPFVYPQARLWLMLIGVYVYALLISIPRRFYTAAVLRAVLHIPLLAIAMINAILKMKANRRYFIHTPKTYSTK